MLKQSVFISGPITSDGNLDENLNRFESVAQSLSQTEKYTRVFHTGQLVRGQSEGYYMAQSLNMLIQADVVLFLVGWNMSAGCLSEYYLAKKLKKEIRFIDCAQRQPNAVHHLLSLGALEVDDVQRPFGKEILSKAIDAGKTLRSMKTHWPD